MVLRLAFCEKNKFRDKCIITILYPVLLSVSEDKVKRMVQEILQPVKEREKAVKTKLTEIKVTQQKMYETKLDDFQSYAARLESCLKCGRRIEKRNSGREILEGKHDQCLVNARKC